MKKVLPLVLCLLVVLTPVVALAPTAFAAGDYYDAYNYQNGYPTIMNALQSMKVDPSYNHRAQIAAANGISGFKGTSAQNHTMLALLMAGGLRKENTTYVAPAPKAGCYAVYKGAPTVSIVDALKSVNAPASYASRKAIASANGISNFKGTSAQNCYMLGLLMTGNLKVAPAAAKTATAATVNTGCYAIPTIKTGSIVDALKNIGVDPSYEHRKRIANANAANIIDGTAYNGAAVENIRMLEQLYSGNLKMAA